MGSILLNPSMSNHPAIRRVSARAVASWVASLCWCSRNGRVDTFPAKAAREFATARVTEQLEAAWLWVRWGDEYVVPDRVMGSGIQLWRFGPAESSRPHISRSLRMAVYERDGHACLHCGATEDLSLDHIVPFSKGGPDTFENLQTLCRPCNSRKGARI